jgi:hypothetical protein
MGNPDPTEIQCADNLHKSTPLPRKPNENTNRTQSANIQPQSQPQHYKRKHPQPHIRKGDIFI